MILAARFSLFTGDPREASRIAEKFLTVRGSSPSTAFEAEARCIDYWCALARMEERLQDDPSSGLMPEQMRQLQAMDDQFRSLSQTEGTLDIDSLMLWARSRQIISMRADVLNILNQVIP